MGKKFIIFCSIFIMLFTLIMCSCSSQQSSSGTVNQTESIEQEGTTIPQSTPTIETESKDTMYKMALSYFSEGDYNSALPIFEYLGNYERSADYLIACDFILQLSGFYTYRKSNELFIFEIGKNVTVMDGDYRITKFKTVTLENKDGEYRLVAEGDFGTYVFVNRDGTIQFFSYGNTPTNPSTADHYESLRKMPDDYGFPTEPQIGMTAEEVRNSTWGDPQDINTTITAYHTTEQWCYSNNRYVYLEDGIVTSIQK